MLPDIVYSEAARLREEIVQPEPWLRGIVCLAFSVLVTAVWVRTPLAHWSFKVDWDPERMWWTFCKNFREEYKPLILGYVLALRPVRAVRRLRTDLRNRAIRRKNGPSLLQLPDEILLEICELTALVKCKRGRINDEECEDQRTASAALINLAATCSHMRKVAAGTLFSAVAVKQKSWRMAGRALKAMEKSTYLPHATKELTMDLKIPLQAQQPLLFLGIPIWTPGTWKPTHLPQQLARQLLALERLTKLRLVFPQGHVVEPYTPEHPMPLEMIDSLPLSYGEPDVGPFEAAFKRSNPLFPSISTLILGPGLEWTIPLCPNVQYIRTDKSRDSLAAHSSAITAVRAAQHLEKLQHLEVYSNVPMLLLMNVRMYLPHIQSLGSIEGDYESGIDRILNILPELSELRTLVMADIGKLHVGYRYPQGRCGNPYLGPGGRARLDMEMREEHLRRQYAIQQVGDLVFARVGGLEELWVGDHDRAVATRNESGGLESVTWSQELRHGSEHAHRFGL